MLLVLLVAAPAGAAAQRDRTVVGGQVGYARSWISTNSDSLNSVSEDRQGASVGLFLRTRVFKWISLQPEIDLTIKGGTFPIAGTPGGLAQPPSSSDTCRSPCWCDSRRA